MAPAADLPRVYSALLGALLGGVSGLRRQERSRIPGTAETCLGNPRGLMTRGEEEGEGKELTVKGVGKWLASHNALYLGYQMDSKCLM